MASGASAGGAVAPRSTCHEAQIQYLQVRACAPIRYGELIHQISSGSFQGVVELDALKTCTYVCLSGLGWGGRALTFIGYF